MVNNMVLGGQNLYFSLVLGVALKQFLPTFFHCEKKPFTTKIPQVSETAPLDVPQWQQLTVLMTWNLPPIFLTTKMQGKIRNGSLELFHASFRFFSSKFVT